jgi:uncharacterized protein (DUF4415 family)
MKSEYDLATLKSRGNPHAQRLTQEVTLWLSPDVVSYFKAQSEEYGIPYQTLINHYLQDCTTHQRKLDLHWSS